MTEVLVQTTFEMVSERNLLTEMANNYTLEIVWKQKSMTSQRMCTLFYLWHLVCVVYDIKRQKIILPNRWNLKHLRHSRTHEGTLEEQHFLPHKEEETEMKTITQVWYQHRTHITVFDKNMWAVNLTGVTYGHQITNFGMHGN